MTSETWAAVDGYYNGLFLPPDPALDQALRDSDAAGLPRINVSAAQGKMLHLFARAVGARRILEIGTLGGFSTIWLARALAPGGRLITLEFSPKHADVARANIERAKLSPIVDIRVGKAIDSLPRLAQEQAGPFDLIFIDADKESTADYFAWALKLGRPGAMIIVDNVVRKGAITDAASEDSSVRGIRRFNEACAKEPRISATVVQTVGAKGYDGFVLALMS